jgi:hypothetical protein
MRPFGNVWPITIPEGAKVRWCYPESLNVKMRFCYLSHWMWRWGCAVLSHWRSRWGCVIWVTECEDEMMSWVTECEDGVLLSESLNVKMRRQCSESLNVKMRLCYPALLNVKMRLCCPESLNVRMRLCCPESLNIKISKIPSYCSRPIHLFHIFHQIRFLYLGFFSITLLYWKSSFSTDTVGPTWHMSYSSEWFSL